MSYDNLNKVENVVRKFTRRVRMYKEGYISIHVFLNVDSTGRKFYDTVIYRKIKKGDGFEHVRGANLKPADVPIVIKLLKEVDEFLQAELLETAQ